MSDVTSTSPSVSAPPPPHPHPQPAYLPTSPTSPLLIDRSLYSLISSSPRHVLYTHTLPPRTGHAFHISAGCILRISTPKGPQVGDLNLWNAHNPRERFWASRTRQLHASHVSVGDRLWSCLPYLRPMVTIIADSLKGRPDLFGDYGNGNEKGRREDRSEFGGRVHDLLGTRCDPYVNAMLRGDSQKQNQNQFDFHCHSNLVRAILPHGLTEPDVHDVLNLFQVTGLDDRGRYFMEPSPARAGDYVDFFAEMDLLCALSACPGGDLSNWGFGPESARGMEECCRELRVEVFEIADGNYQEEVLKRWMPPEMPAYRGYHGLRWKERDMEMERERERSRQ